MFKALLLTSLVYLAPSPLMAEAGTQPAATEAADEPTMSYSDRQETGIFSFLFGAWAFVWVHENGHAMATRYYGYEVEEMKVSIMHGHVRTNMHDASKHEHIAVSAAGSLTNWTAAMLLAPLNVFFTYGSFLHDMYRSTMRLMLVDWVAYVVIDLIMPGGDWTQVAELSEIPLAAFLLPAGLAAWGGAHYWDLYWAKGQRESELAGLWVSPTLYQARMPGTGQRRMMPALALDYRF